MNSILYQIVHLLQANSAPSADVVAQNLMERAEALAGSHPYQAAELRSAASAYLSVIR